MSKIVTDMKTWIMDYANDRIYRYLVYRKMFTPYEQQKAFADETQFDDYHYSFAKIEEAIDIGNDWLIGMRTVDPETGCEEDIIEYHKLSDIKISYFKDEERIEEE